VNRGYRNLGSSTYLSVVKEEKNPKKNYSRPIWMVSGFIYERGSF